MRLKWHELFNSHMLSTAGSCKTALLQAGKGNIISSSTVKHVVLAAVAERRGHAAERSDLRVKCCSSWMRLASPEGSLFDDSHDRCSLAVITLPSPRLAFLCWELL